METISLAVTLGNGASFSMTGPRELVMATYAEWSEAQRKSGSL